MKFQSLLNKIYPQPPIAGLEVDDTALRLVEMKKGSPLMRGLRLPPGVVAGGRVKDKVQLTAAVKELVEPSRGAGKMGIVLTVPSNDVFIQTVNLPPVAARNLEEAADLNVQMVSPLRPGEFYYDWQKVMRGGPEGGPIELLGAFVSRATVNDFTDCLREAGLSLVAVEFTSLSLVRLLSQKKITEPGQPYLLVKVAPEGTTFLLAIGGQLLFHSFHDWRAVQKEGERIKADDFLRDLTNEANKISSFYLAHWGGVVNDVVFISSGLENEIKGAFKDKNVLFVHPEEAVSAAGAAVRSILGEKEINLLGTTSLHVFNQNRALTFVALWRTILAATFGFLLLASLGSDLFLRKLAGDAAETNALTLNEPDHKELLALKEKAAKFNGLTALVKGARGGEGKIGGVAEKVNNLAGVEIAINRLYIPSIDAPITISGGATSEQAAIAFKNRLASEKGFTGVELPISSIAPDSGGRVSFTISFQVSGSPLGE